MSIRSHFCHDKHTWAGKKIGVQRSNLHSKLATERRPLELEATFDIMYLKVILSDVLMNLSMMFAQDYNDH